MRKTGMLGQTGSADGARQKGCSMHRSTTHSDVECYSQGALRPQTGCVYRDTIISARILPIDGGDEKPAFDVAGFN